MYKLKEETAEMFKVYKLNAVAERVGMNYRTLSEMINKDRSCIKITAYALTKFLDSEKEIDDLFDRVGA